MIVWGFRPTYAIYPAFRQNKTGDIEKLYDGSDTYYQAKISQQRLSKKEMFNLWLENHSFLYGKRMVIKDKITAFINHYGLYFLKSFISDIRMRELEDNFVSKRLSVSDFLLKQLSGGCFAMVEETVADRGDKFVKGKKVSFDESFIPDIASMISEAGIPQLVIIFKPVSHAENRLDPESLKFAEDSKKYFEANSISFINFLKDARIVSKFYAKGDHYNMQGRELISKTVGDKLVSMLEEIGRNNNKYSIQEKDFGRR